VTRRAGRATPESPDLIIAAAAELGGATVLHYDPDHDRIAAVTGQPDGVGRTTGHVVGVG
jgi:predicted nucleic acid-binding protein